MNIFKWTPLQLLFTVAFKEWWKLLNNVEYYMTCFSKHMHWMFQSEKSVFQIRWIADSCCVYWMLQMEWKINVGRRLRKWRILKSALCLNSSNLKVDQIISYITLKAKEISFSLLQKKKKKAKYIQDLCCYMFIFWEGDVLLLVFSSPTSTWVVTYDQHFLSMLLYQGKP